MDITQYTITINGHFVSPNGDENEPLVFDDKAEARKFADEIATWSDTVQMMHRRVRFFEWHTTTP